MKKITFAFVTLALAGCSTGPILTSRPSESGATPPPSATALGYPSASVAASPLPDAELVGRIRSKTSVEPCQTLIVDKDGHRWEVWLPDGYKTAFEGQDEVIYGPDGAVVARTGQRLGIDIDETASFGSFCMAGRPVQATKVVFVTDATGPDVVAAKAWPCSPAVAAPAYADTPGATPPPVYLGRADGTIYEPTIQGSFSWMEETQGGDATFALQAYVSEGGAPPTALRTTSVAALALPEPYRIDWWNISVSRWVPEAWTPEEWMVKAGATVFHLEESGQPTPAVCLEAPPGEYFVSASLKFAGDRGNSVHVYGRLTVTGGTTQCDLPTGRASIGAGPPAAYLELASRRYVGTRGLSDRWVPPNGGVIATGDGVYPRPNAVERITLSDTDQLMFSTAERVPLVLWRAVALPTNLWPGPSETAAVVVADSLDAQVRAVGFCLGAPPVGDWMIQIRLNYGDSMGTSNFFWRLIVDG